jgi:hypothetical protein
MAGFGFGEWKRTFNECQAAAEQGIADERAGLKAHEGRAMEELSQQDPGKWFVPESLLNYASQVPQFSQYLNFQGPRGPIYAPPYHMPGAFVSEPIDLEKVGRITKRKPAPKGKGKGKKKKMEDIDEDSDESEADNGGKKKPDLWTDAEIQQLISFRSEMDEEFKHNAKKQGVRMWDKLQQKMIVACDGFTKTEESCRKKWKQLFKIYCTDKRANGKSGNHRKQTCKYYDEIDLGWDSCTNVRKLSHSDARGGDYPWPIGSGEEDMEQDSWPPEGSTPEVDAPPATVITTPSSGPKKSQAELIASLMGEMVTQTKSIAANMKETTGVLKVIRNNFEKLLEKVW